MTEIEGYTSGNSGEDICGAGMITTGSG